MATKWTKDQASVIEHRGSNLLVAAAAGSGKTAVLIERIVGLVTDKKNPIDIDKLLVVTFTNAAANEMKERIGIALEEALDKDPDNEHLQRQVLILNRADITTINSFCGRVVRDNFHASDLDPNVRIGDPAEIEMIKKDLIEEVFEELYDKKDESFLSLVDVYSSRNNDKALMDMVLVLNNFVDSSPYPEVWLDDAAEKFNISKMEDEDIINCHIIPSISYELEIFKTYLYRLRLAIEQLGSYDELVGYRINLNEHESYLSDIFSHLYSIEIDAQDSYNRVFDGNLYDQNNEISISDQDLTDLKEKIDSYRLGQESIKKFRVGSKLNPYIKDEYNRIKKQVDSTLKKLKECTDKLYISVDDIRLELEMVYPYMRKLSNLTKIFREAYRAKKKSLGIIDFADTEHTALEILTDRSSGSVEASKVGQAYMDMYEEVFIDEYQDSNMVQELILSTISRSNPGNRFMVGDIKQSIYRFRQAMPEIFLDKYSNYKFSPKANPSGRKIQLYNNFRSRPQVLEACNHVFMSIMRKSTGELDYTDKERLNPSAIFKDLSPENIEDNLYKLYSDIGGWTSWTEALASGVFNTGGPVEVRLVEKKFSKEDFELDYTNKEDFNTTSTFRMQCQAMANYIYNLVNSKEKTYLVFDKKTDKYRKIEYRDIVILLRSPSSKVSDIEDIFGHLSIPLYSDLGGDYFSTLEVSIFTNLLRIIDNPRQDISLLSVMRSPIYSFKPRDLALLRLLDRNMDFYDLLLKLYNTEENDLKLLASDYRELRDKIVNFIDQIEMYRKKSIFTPLDEFIWFLLKDTGYYAYVGGLSMGEHRQNNLMLFFERARKFEKSSFKGLFNFVNYIDRVKTRGADFGEAKEVSDQANVVRLMSIHKSKGLEFPLVIIANTEGKFNFRSKDTRLSLHQDLGYGPEVIDKLRRLRFPSLAKKYIDQKMKLEQIAEEMRLLYVAMTRAKEKLVLFASLDDYSKSIEKWTNVDRDKNGDIDRVQILESSNYLDWIMMSIANLETRGTALDSLGEEQDYVGYKDCKWVLNLEDKLGVYKKYKDLEARSFDMLDSSDRDDIVGLKKENEISEDVNKEGNENNKRISLIKPYSYEASASKPASISVSEVKKIIESQDQSNYEKIYMNRDIPVLKTPSFIHSTKNQVAYSQGEKGTIFHLVMELLDFESLSRIKSKDTLLENRLEKDLKLLVTKKILSQEELDTVNRKWIIDFAKTGIFDRMCQASSKGLLHRETAIDYNIGLNKIYKDENIDDNERLMLVGIIDVFFEDEDGNLILLDYKTDHVNKVSYSKVVDKYRPQLDLYAQALENISGKKVKEKYIYLFSIGDLVSYD